MGAQPVRRIRRAVGGAAEQGDHVAPGYVPDRARHPWLQLALEEELHLVPAAVLLLVPCSM